jgi:hypothetical protein
MACEAERGGPPEVLLGLLLAWWPLVPGGKSERVSTVIRSRTSSLPLTSTDCAASTGVLANIVAGANVGGQNHLHVLGLCVTDDTHRPRLRRDDVSSKPLSA